MTFSATYLAGILESVSYISCIVSCEKFVGLFNGRCHTAKLGMRNIKYPRHIAL